MSRRRYTADEVWFRFPKVCGCGATWTALTWRGLDYVGLQIDTVDGDLDLRQCLCGSTIAMPTLALDRG